MVTPAERLEWFSGEFVQRHIHSALEWGVGEWRMIHSSMFRANFLHAACFESPLEMAFYAWWTVMTNVRTSHMVSLRMQVPVQAGGKDYRIDIELTDEEYDSYYAKAGVELGLRPPRIAVELDGHDFHERTKEQVIYRDARDRALQAEGWTVFHVSGAALHRTPAETVWGIYGDASQVIWDFRHRVNQMQAGRV
jgi:hypothetical protein